MKNILTLLILNISICLSAYSQSNFKIFDLEKYELPISFSNQYNWYVIEFPEENYQIRRLKKINPSEDIKYISSKIKQPDNTTIIKHGYLFRNEFTKCKKILIGSKDSLSTQKQFLFPNIENNNLRIGDEYPLHHTTTESYYYKFQVNGFVNIPIYPDSTYIEHIVYGKQFKQNIDSLISYNSKFNKKENLKLEYLIDIDGDQILDIVLSLNENVFLLLSYKKILEKNIIYHLEDSCDKIGY